MMVKHCCCALRLERRLGGSLAQVATPGNTLTFDNETTGRVSKIARSAVGLFSNRTFDWRGFLAAFAGGSARPLCQHQ